MRDNILEGKSITSRGLGAVVGIDLGQYKIICSSGEIYEFPFLKLENTSSIFEIKKQWKESIAVQLLIKYDFIAFENLEENDNTTTLFKDMLDFPNIVKEKSTLYEKKVHILKEKYQTTQECNVCGYINNKLKLNISIKNWKCPQCKREHDRDLNAAINILKHGLVEYNNSACYM